MRLKNERFFHRFNKLFCSLFYLRHQGKSTVIVDAEGGTRFWVRVNTFDIVVIWEIWKAKVYDDTRFPIGPEDVVVDLGAHIGAFAVRAAKLAHHGHVYAYEASSKNYALLTENRQLNGLENFHIENRAVSDRRVMMPFYIPSENGVLGSLLQKTSRYMEMVQATTLHDIVAEHGIARIDFLKVDVEGAEYDILFNCPDETLAKIRRVVMEYHEFDGEKRTHLDLMKLLRSHGFNVLVERGIIPQTHWFGTGISRIGIIKAWRA
jgi:FkbM family methyltransferase